MLKTLKSFLLQNHWADCIETWYVVSGELVQIVYINDDPGLTLTYFYGKVRYNPLGFEWKKLKKCIVWLLLTSLIQ